MIPVRPALLLAVLVFFPLGAWAQTTEDALSHTERGDEWYFTMDYAGALAEYGEAIRLDPLCAEAWAGRGIVYYAVGRWEEGHAAFAEAARLDAVYDAFQRGVAAWKEREYDQAVEELTRAILRTPGYAPAYFYRGLVYYYKGFRFDDRAIADYTEAVRLGPAYAVAYNNRGTCHFRGGNYDAAIADYDEAIRLTPDYADAFWGRGFGRLYKADYDQAIADFTESLRLNPAYPNSYIVYHNRGMAYHHKKDYEHAIADYTEAIRLKPGNAETWYNRGRARADSGDPAGAAADFAEAVRLSPFLYKNPVQ